MSLSYIKLRISERYNQAKEEWHAQPAHHGAEEIPPPPPKKNMLDRARNSVARVAAQIRTGHWRSAMYLKRIWKRKSDRCWLCEGTDRTPHRMSRSHVLLNCRNPRVAAARAEAREGNSPGNVRRLLADPKWERRCVHVLELSSVSISKKYGVLLLLHEVMEAMEVMDVFFTSQSYPVWMGCFRKQRRSNPALPEATPARGSASGSNQPVGNPLF
jgi:hypothetical protein